MLFTIIPYHSDQGAAHQREKVNDMRIDPKENAIKFIVKTSQEMIPFAVVKPVCQKCRRIINSCKENVDKRNPEDLIFHVPGEFDEVELSA